MQWHRDHCERDVRDADAQSEEHRKPEKDKALADAQRRQGQMAATHEREATDRCCGRVSSCEKPREVQLGDG